MSQLHGKQVKDVSVELKKFDLSGSQGTYEYGTGTFLAMDSLPTNAKHLANKEYVDGLATGLDLKESVKVISTAPITLTGTQTIDGEALVAGDRILVAGQGGDLTTPSADNGIYVVAVGAWSRASDSDGTPTNEVTLGNHTFIEYGSLGGSAFVLVVSNATDASNAIIPGTDTQQWSKFSSIGDVAAGQGITLTNGTTINSNADGTITTNITVGATTYVAGTDTVQTVLDAINTEVNNDDSIYANDGTLTGARAINGNSNSLSFNSLSTFFADGGGTEFTLDSNGASFVLAGKIDLVAQLGVTIPNLTTANRVALVAPTTGTIVFDTDLSSFYVYNGTIWDTWDNTGDISDVSAGNGLIGGGNTGAVTLNVGAGTGISVQADDISANAGATLTNGVTIGATTLTTTDSVQTAIETLNTQLGTVASGSVNAVTGGDGITATTVTGTVDIDVNAGTGITLTGDAVNATADATLTNGVTIGATTLTTTDSIQTAIETLNTSLSGAVQDVTGGDGITATETSGVIDIDVNAGTGITLTGDAVNATADATLTSAISDLSLTTTNSVQEALDALTLKRGSKVFEQEQNATVTAGDNSALALTISGTPTVDSSVDVYVNGVQQKYSTDYYFSSDGTLGGARATANLVENGDTFVWNGVASGFELDTSDVLNINYLVLS